MKQMPKTFLEDDTPTWKVTIDKEWHTPNFDFLCVKSSSPGQFLGNSNLRRCHRIFKLLAAT